MPTLEIRDRSNKVVGKVEVGAGVFDRPVKRSLLHEAVVHHEAGLRRGTHATKTRSEVRGASRKPWRQKGTGRARAGDRRSPVWRSGGVTFGPHPRDHATRFPHAKMRRALQMALSAKCAEGAIVIVDDLGLEAAKTRQVAEMLATLELQGRTLIYDPAGDESLVLAARNLQQTKVISGRGLTVYDLLLHDNLLTTEVGISKIDEALR